MISFSISFILRYIIALLAIAFYTLIERKFLGYFQLRKGPNKVMLIGLPQPFADAIKLFAKEQVNPTPSQHLTIHLCPHPRSNLSLDTLNPIPTLTPKIVLHVWYFILPMRFKYKRLHYIYSRMVLQLQICPAWGTAWSRPNNLIRSLYSPHPSLCANTTQIYRPKYNKILYMTYSS